MRQRPLKFIHQFRYEEGLKLFDQLEKKAIKVAVLSDFHPSEKLMAMGYSCQHVYASESESINQLKPSPKGILHIIEELKVSIAGTVYIGDRDDTDGQASERAGVSFINVKGAADKIYSLIQERLIHAR